ncbi:NUDIX domain-containing protein [Verrucosispora sp. NA02020]|uniref:NUDIX hydrolase n=1 Tax=Verrucosispora sp. NA02020 TaxID=2742132 RepID=UPI0020CA609A|nr:NUDIX domain-containing protein [Verrucosispora sp. NA02020]
MNERPTDDLSRANTSVPALPAIAGDGWVNCAQGHAHWGRFGAAGLLPVHRSVDGEAYVLMHHRGTHTDQGGTWALLGGARDSHESAVEAALREAAEESDLVAASARFELVVRDDHGGWSYDTVIVSFDQRAAVRPVEDESVAVDWVPLSEVQDLRLHPGFAASWPKIQSALDDMWGTESFRAAATPATVQAVTAPSLPAHPATDAQVVARTALDHGDGIAHRALVTFSDDTLAVLDQYVQVQDAHLKVLDAYVGRAVGARVPLTYPLGSRDVYTDYMPGEPASAHYLSLRKLADDGVPATRDGVCLGLYFALTATHGVDVDQVLLGAQQSLITVTDSVSSHGALPDAANPFVQTFYRQVEPHVFAWVDNPISAVDVEIVRRQLDGLRPVFEQFGRSDLHDTVMERFGQVAAHAVGTVPLLPLLPGDRIALPASVPRRHAALAPPPGSPERTDQQQISEALLTDDGRITETGQAKTIAIEAIAERMRSSTPELVLAAFGLAVGTDMAHRLGDGRYVLAPHNEQYPSMGADVLHVDELDEANPRHAPDRVVRMDDPHAEILVRWIGVSELMSSWSYGSNNNVRVLALQEAAKEEFGLTEVLEWRMDSKTRNAVALELDYNRDALRDFLRTQYEMTQETLASRNITEVLVYRALTWQEGAARPSWSGLSVGDTFEARQRPLASWAADRQIVADWLEKRGGHAVILVDRKPARDVLSIPATGMGYFAQKELVTLPGDGLVTLDGVITGKAPAVEAEQTAASSISLGAPSLEDAAPATTNGTDERQVPAKRWDPLPITARLDPADPVDSRIIRVLDGEDEAPDWWPRDDSGYAITKRDLDFLGINPVQVKWMLTGEAPMGMTPDLYRRFGAEMLEALRNDGIDPAQVDIRIKGTGAGFFSGQHKTMLREEDLPAEPTTRQRLRDWFGAGQDRPLRRPYDAMWRLGIEREPSDIDLDINSTAMVRAARTFWRSHHSDRYLGDFMNGHGYLDKQTAMGALPALAEWSRKWEETLGRPLSLGIFESSGPFDATVLGRSLSSHFRDTDWVIHSPDAPMAWRNPRPRSTELAGSRGEPIPSTTPAEPQIAISQPSGTSSAAAAAAKAFPRSTRRSLPTQPSTRQSDQSGPARPRSREDGKSEETTR